MLDAQELGAMLRQAKRSLFRLEMQPAYDVPTDGNDFSRYLAGEPWPDLERKERWLLFLREQRDKGIYRSRVRVVRIPLSDYDRYASEWGYCYNVPAGDDTRIAEVGKLLRDAWMDGINHDFWLVDNQVPIRMNYDDGGRFVNADVLNGAEGPRYRDIKDALWVNSEPFEQWWQRHPEYHRSARKAS
jgi:hypothetical protein